MKFKKSIVVVEIGNDWLKILGSSPDGYINKVSFTKLAQITGPVSDALSKIFKSLKLSKGSVITYIPRHLSTVRILELPSTHPNEISEMINLQISKQTPYTKEEIIFDHKIIDTGREGYTKVMLAISRRNVVSERIKTLQQAGVEVGKVTTSSEGVYNWFDIAYLRELKPDNSQGVILIDVDSNYSDFIVIHRRRLIFTRNILIGANQLIEEPEAWQEKFVEELKRSMDLFQSRERNIKIMKVFLSGASKNIKGLDQLLNTTLDIPAEITDMLKNIKIKKDAVVLQENIFKFISITPLIGLSLRYKEPVLDLTPSDLRIQTMMDEKRRELTIMGALIMSIAMLASFLLFVISYNKSVYLGQLKQKIAKIKNESAEIENMRMRINLVERRIDAKGATINIFNEMHKLIPREIYLTALNLEEKGNVTLKGRAFAMSDVFKFITAVENSEYFENVKATYTTTKKEKDEEYAEFEIVCTYENGISR